MSHSRPGAGVDYPPYGTARAHGGPPDAAGRHSSRGSRRSSPPRGRSSPACPARRRRRPVAGTVDWAAHGANAAHTQSSPLDQITPKNVASLKVAWTYHTGDARPDRSQIQCNPIVVRGVLYATSPQLKVFALDAATGQPKWVFDPFTAGADQSGLGVNRGVVYWEGEGGRDARILVGAGYTLFALDAATGKPIESFGTKGGVDLRAGLGDWAKSLYVVANTPGAIYKDLLIQGTRVGEGPGPSAPGYVRAYNVRTGAIAWTFHTIPQPGEPGYETWPADAWKRVGGANSWSGVTVDRERGLVFLPTGSAAFDFWGGNRKGDNLYANSLLVLKADTGAHVWHYQFVRHDIWDRDLPQSPVLVTVRRDGRSIPAVAQATKTGHVYVFDRETGAPLFPMEEQPVPPSDLEGEVAAATQPVPKAPPAFARQLFTEDQITDLSPEATASVRERWLAAKRGSTWAPPSTQGTIIFPGFDGGAEWGGSRVRRALRAVLRERQRDAVDPPAGEAGQAGRRRRAGRPPHVSGRSAAPATARTGRAIRCGRCRRSTASRAGCRARRSRRSSRTGAARCRRSRSSRPRIARR